MCRGGTWNQSHISSGYLCPSTGKASFAIFRLLVSFNRKASFATLSLRIWSYFELVQFLCFFFFGPCRILCLFMFLVPLIYLVCVCQIVMQLILLSVVRPWNALRSWYLITRLFEDVAPNELIFIWVWVTIPKFWLSIQGSVIFSF